MSNYEISKSSLLSLKAEILRKQEEIKNKTNETVKKRVPLVIKNKGVDKRIETDTVEDLDVLDKSRLALEKKAKLYEKLSKAKQLDNDPDSFHNRFLVRFQDKYDVDESAKDYNDIEDEDIPGDYNDPNNSDEEWVEYTDCLGRTRTCLKKDLDYCKSRDKDYKRDGGQEETVTEKTDEVKPIEIPEEAHLLSDDMRREMLRQQWEKEEEELRFKDNIHYQDVLFNEARSHGVGYFSFSRDEEERKRQQASLDKLRDETKQQQQKSQELKAMRERQLAARVKAAKQRKRERLGLPPEDDEEEEIGPQLPETSPPETVVNEEDALKERLLAEARKSHVRPWDIGKERKHRSHEYTQEEWVEKKRKERKEDFAPPSTYRRDFRATPQEPVVKKVESNLKFTTKKTGNSTFTNSYRNPNEDLKDPFDEQTRKFTPYKGTTKRKIETVVEDNVTLEASIEAGLKFLRKQVENNQDEN